MAEKRVSVRMTAEGGRQVRSEFEGVGKSGDQSLKRIERTGVRLGPMFARILVAAKAALAVGISSAALRGAREIDQAAKSARRLGSSIGGFRAVELAADEAGVAVSALTDVLQTVDRELTRAGEGGKADEALARLSLSARDLVGLDADRKVALIAQRIEELGLSTGETTRVLQELGVRNREAALLFLSGGEAIRAARRDIEDYGLALSQVDADRIEKANDAIGRLSLIGQKLRQVLALEIVPALGEMAQKMTDSLREGGALRAVIDGLGIVIGHLGRGISAVVTIIASAVSWIRDLAVALYEGSTFVQGFFKAFAVLGGFLTTAYRWIYNTVTGFADLVRGAGGFGEAMQILGGVASGAFEWIANAAGWATAKVEEYFYGLEANLAASFARIGDKWADLVSALAPGMSLIPGLGVSAEALMASATQARGLRAASADAYGNMMAAGGRASAFEGAMNRPIAGMDKLREAMARAGEEGAAAMDRASQAVTDFGDAADREGGGGGGGRSTKSLDAIKDAAQRVRERVEQMKAPFQEFFTSIVTGASSVRDALSNLLAKFAEMLANQAFQMIWGEAKPWWQGTGNTGISGWLSKILPWAQGGAFSAGRVIPFASGGIVASPTLFPLRGATGLMGEAGPEAILPLSRIGGRLGVAAQPQEIVVRLAMSPDVEARVEARATAATVRVVEEYDRTALPRRMAEIGRDPRGIR